MSKKRKEKKAKRLAQEMLPPEDSPLMDCPPAWQFVLACRYRKLALLADFVSDMNEKHYHAFWRVACFFILKPTRDGTMRHAEYDQIWEEFKNMNDTIKDPQLRYLLNKRVTAVINSDSEKQAKGKSRKCT